MNYDFLAALDAIDDAAIENTEGVFWEVPKEVDCLEEGVDQGDRDPL